MAGSPRGRRTVRTAWAAALLAGALVLSACSSEPDPTSSDYVGTYIGDEPFRVADVPLTDTDGEPYSIATDDSKLKLVFFGYTKCPDICIAVMSTIGSALTRLDADQREQVEVVFVTTDPARDDSPALREYLDRFAPEGAEPFVGLTGAMKDILRLGDSLHVAIEDGRKLSSGGYEVDHTTYTYGVLGDGADLFWRQDVSPRQMATDMIKLLDS